MTTRTGCWTCKARRVQCDGYQPACLRCALAKRPCEGYQKRLSWPRDNDRKRAIIAPSSLAIPRRTGGADLYFINTTWQDIEVYRCISRLVPSPQPPPALYGQPGQEVNQTELIHYFHRSAYLALITFSATNSQLRDVLIHLALPNDTASDLALQYALLAFSSLRRDGLNKQATQLKIAAIGRLAVSARARLSSSREAAQHVAASMLLGAFEIMVPCGSSGDWMLYVWGAMDVAKAHQLQGLLHNIDISVLLDWVYYHNALSRFTQHHSQQMLLALEATATGDSNTDDVLRQSIARHGPVDPSPNPSHMILNLLTEICDAVITPLDTSWRNEEQSGRLRALERKLGGLSVTATTAECSADTTLLPVNLYDLSTRIYLARASQTPWEPPARLDSLIEMAFSVATSATTCRHFFPLFVVACEARTDERRSAILRLIQSNEKCGVIRSMEGLKTVITSIWVQQDLHVDNDLLPNYLGIMSSAISSSGIFPSFV